MQCDDNANTTNSTIRVSHVPLNAGRKADRLTVLTLKWGNVVQYYRVSTLEGSVVREAKSEGLIVCYPTTLAPVSGSTYHCHYMQCDDNANTTNSSSYSSVTCSTQYIRKKS